MGIGQPRGSLAADGHCLLRGHQDPGIEEILEGSAGQELGHQIRDRVIFSPVVHLQDGRVVQGGNCSSLSPEPLQKGLVLGQRRLQDLDRHLTLEGAVLGPVDDRRGSGAEHRLEAVPASEDASDVVRGRSHE